MQIWRLATLPAALIMAGCVVWSGQYGVAINADGQTATLSNYGGADAESQLDNFVRNYCGGAFRAVRRTQSTDGRAHGVTFECEGSK